MVGGRYVLTVAYTMLLPILLLIYIRTSIVIHGGELVEGVEDQAVLPDHYGSHQGTHGQHIVCLTHWTRIMHRPTQRE